MGDFSLDDELIFDYLAESREHLATIETDLLAIERAGAAVDEQLVNRVFRAAHSIKGGAGFFDLLQIKELAHHTENVLALVRSGQMVPDSEIVSILLLAFDKLRSLIQDYRDSNEADISEFTAALSRLAEVHLSPSQKTVLASPITQILDVQPERVQQIENSGAATPIAGPGGAEPGGAAVEPPLNPSDCASDAAGSGTAGAAPDIQPGPTEQLAKLSSAMQTAPVETTVRLNVALLESLMTLAGELVLGRNQLNEAVSNNDMRGISAGAHRVSLVTSELQEAVSLTRMQPVSSLFSKFPRLVRDLAGQLGKEVQLKLEGGEVELDKTIIEGLSDPLTHMVRNSVDHGIEPSAVRVTAGKPAQGTVTLRARHQAGQVMIEISDDGKGLAAAKIVASALSKGLITAEQAQTMSEYEKQALIFMPGVSTAKELSNVSGRGVGMDVVKTNLDKLGGKVEIDSVPGKGSAFRIKLPLTLAIIPSLLVSESGERFAIPQVSVGELIRIPPGQIAERIDRAGDAEVVLLRDRLVPLVHLAEALGGPRKERGAKALNVVLVDAGTFEYGLVVEDLHDTVEIVVKPMGRHLQGLHEYAGATILGDGQVAVILDVAGLAKSAGLSRASAASVNAQSAAEDTTGEIHSLLLFHNAPGEHCAVPIELVTRVERVRTEQIEHLGGRRTMQYGGVSLPLVTLNDVAAVDELVESQQWVVVVFDCAGRTVGLVVAEPLDMIETRLEMDTVTLRQPGVAGSALLNGATTLMLDIFELADTVRRRWPESEAVEPVVPSKPGSKGTVLVVEDSDFFRVQIKRLIEAVGYEVLAAEDGQAAWELLDHHANEISVVTTDVDMPRLDGLALTKRIRADARFTGLPVIALSTLAAEEEMARGLAIGVSEYQVKLDQSQLLESIRKAVAGMPLGPSPVTQ